MFARTKTARLSGVLILGVVLFALAGADCEFDLPSTILLPPPVINPPVVAGDPVTVELVNVTADAVDAFLWADPGTVYVPEDVMRPENFVDPGGLLLPGDIVTVTLECRDAGTFLADGDLVLPSGDAILSDNLILLLEGQDFLCGDLVSFYYEVDAAGVFFISADVNDVTIAP